MNMNKNCSVNERTRIILQEIDNEIKRLQDELKYIDPDNEDYAVVNGQLAKLIESKKILNEIERNETNGNKIKLDPNTVFSALSMLALTLVILKYEKMNTITSKAFSFIPKLLRHV